MMTPWAPAHSAVRRMAPRLWGVGDLVAHHQQGRLALFRGGGQNALHRGVFPDSGQRDNALMGVGAGHTVQLAAVGLHHHDARVPGLGGDVAQRLVRLALGKVDLVDGGADAQGLDHGVAPLDDAVSLRVGQGAALSILHISHRCDLVFLCIPSSIPHYLHDRKKHS